MSKIDVSEKARLDLRHSHNQIRSQLQSHLTSEYVSDYSMDSHNEYPYVVDVFGDEKAGICVYSMGDSYFRCDYTISADGVDMAEPGKVELAYMPASESAAKSGALKPGEQCDERYISHKTRQSMPEEDFAGKSRTFPIESPSDVVAAASSIGRAGSGNYSAEELKKKITAIANRKGDSYVKKLPKSWKGSEAVVIEGEIVPLVEKAVKDGLIKVKLIQPGFGSSGYYPKETLSRDGPSVFKKGIKMFWNHQTAQEEASRPEGDITNWAGELTEDAHWEDDGPAGSGLYSTAKVFAHYAPVVNEIASNSSGSLGVSIRAYGKATSGTVEGRKTKVIDSLESAKSVDFVTAPGAGGRVLELFESAKLLESNTSGRKPSEGGDMDEKELKALREGQTRMEEEIKVLRADNGRLKEGAILSRAAQIVAEEVEKAKLPTLTKQRIKQVVGLNPPLKDGALDEAALIKRVADSVVEETKYLTEVAGLGRVIGLGDTAPKETSDEDLNKALKESFLGMGVDEKVAGIAAKGRAN